MCDPGELVTWDVGTLDPGGSRVAFYSFLGGITTGEDLREAMGRYNAVASADATGDVSTALNVQLDNTPLLRMSLVPDSGPAVAGEPFGYTLTYVNAGDFSPTGVTLRMPLPEGTQFASATDGGSVEGNVVTWNVGTVVQGEGGQVRLTVDVEAGLPEGALLAARGEVEAGAPAAPPAGASATTLVQGSGPLRLALSAATSGGSGGSLTSMGPEVTHTLTVGNVGTEPLTGVGVALLLSANEGRTLRSTPPRPRRRRAMPSGSAYADGR